MPERKKNLKSILIWLLKLAVVVGAVWYLIANNKIDYKSFKLIPGGAALTVLAAGSILAAMLLTFVRYRLLLGGLEVKIGLGDSCRIGFIGSFFSTFTPGSMGGDVVKMAYLIKETGRRAESVSSVMVDRVLGLLGLICLGGLALLFSWDEVVRNPGLHTLVLAVFGVLGAAGMCTLLSLVALARGRKWGAAAWLLLLLGCSAFAYLALRRDEIVFSLDLRQGGAALLRGRALIVMYADALLGLACVALVPSCQPGRRLASFIASRVPGGGSLMSLLRAVLAYRECFGTVAASFVMSVFVHALLLFSIYLISQALTLHQYPTAWHITFATPPTFVANTLPMPGGGLGVGEACFDKLLSDASAGAVTGGANVFLFFRLLSLLCSLVGLPLYLRGKKEIEAARAEYGDGEAGVGG